MLRTVVVVGTLLLGVGVVAAQQDQVDKTQLAMKSNLKSALTLLDIVKGTKPYDHAAIFAKAVGEAKVKIKDLDTLKATFPVINDECKGCHETYRIKNS